MSAVESAPAAQQDSGKSPLRNYIVLEKVNGETLDAVLNLATDLATAITQESYREVHDIAERMSSAIQDIPDGDLYAQVTDVDARNHENAVRRAFKAVTADGEVPDEATLAVVPAGMWRPTPITVQRKESVTLRIGTS